MCVAGLNVSTQPCAHRWYELVRSCQPSSNLANCPSKLQLQGWEARVDTCPFCDSSSSSTPIHESTHRLFGSSPSNSISSSRSASTTSSTASDTASLLSSSGGSSSFFPARFRRTNSASTTNSMLFSTSPASSTTSASTSASTPAYSSTTKPTSTPGTAAATTNIITPGALSTTLSRHSSISSTESERGQRHREMNERLAIYLTTHPHDVLPSARKNAPTYPQLTSITAGGKGEIGGEEGAGGGRMGIERVDSAPARLLTGGGAFAGKRPMVGMARNKSSGNGGGLIRMQIKKGMRMSRNFLGAGGAVGG